MYESLMFISLIILIVWGIFVSYLLATDKIMLESAYRMLTKFALFVIVLLAISYLAFEVALVILFLCCLLSVPVAIMIFFRTHKKKEARKKKKHAKKMSDWK